MIGDANDEERKRWRERERERERRREGDREKIGREGGREERRERIGRGEGICCWRFWYRYTAKSQIKHHPQIS